MPYGMLKTVFQRGPSSGPATTGLTCGARQDCGVVR
jgi:hypothetical protein